MGSVKERLKNVTHKVAAPEVVKYWIQQRKRIGAHFLAMSCAVKRRVSRSPDEKLVSSCNEFSKRHGWLRIVCLFVLMIQGLFFCNNTYIYIHIYNTIYI